ncbi:hypothetical protein Pla163_36670 [Planctomycetes bacterium Pla163]|uniref:FG-GAP repeat protein n=1 Tax=Rohdeia mirabilis TaxID=2528008 RepID=A0A518D4X2_9BACT|nr:hypothetical protein Pla163_36670 [Planctomycetes bacterium Pla163]
MSKSTLPRAAALLFLSGTFAPLAAAQIQSEDAKLLASDGSASDTFGRSVSVDGDFAVIGASADSHQGVQSGSAYVFQRQGDAWNQIAKLVPNDGSAGDSFGISVAISGNRIVVGANSDDDLGSSSGSAYVYTRQTNNSWAFERKLLPSDGVAFDLFGSAVAIEGDRVVVGSPNENQVGFATGAAYVFERTSGTNWTQRTKIAPSTLGASEQFGSAIAMSGDRIAFGVTRDDTAAKNAGAVYVYRRQSTTSWTQETKLTATNAMPSDYAGLSVDIDGERVVCGADRYDGGGIDSGAAFVFERQSNGAWIQTGTLMAQDGSTDDRLGQAVQIDGNQILAGAFGNSHAGSQSGAAYAFERNASGQWIQTVKLIASDAAPTDQFGRFAALDNGRALIASLYDDDQGTSSGSVYAVELGNLKANVDTASISSGSAQVLSLRAGAGWAGAKYVMLGSMTGTNGVDLGNGVVLPLSLDAYTTFGATYGLSMTNWLGTLDATGRATAVYRVPAGTPLAFAGLTLHHAFVAVKPGSGAIMASNAVPVRLTN